MRKKQTEAERVREAEWWAARGASIGGSYSGNNFRCGHHPRLEDLDRQGEGRAFSLDPSTGLLTMEWRRR